MLIGFARMSFLTLVPVSRAGITVRVETYRWEPRKSLYKRTGMGEGHEGVCGDVSLWHTVNVPPPRAEWADDMRPPVSNIKAPPQLNSGTRMAG